LDQTRIWDHFQNEGAESFRAARPRLRYLVSRLAAGSKVLDIGIGDGTFERLASAGGHEVHVLDPDPKAIERVAAELRLGDRARAGFGQSIPWPDASFDAVVLSEVLEHLDDPTFEGTLAEAARVLRPQGRLLGTVPADEDLAAQQVVCPDCGRRFHRWGHARSFSPDALRAVLSKRFASVGVERRWFPAWDLLNWRGRALSVARWILSRMGVWGDGHNLVFDATGPRR
jgi:SAM-dependent methyltransferase